jgi:hypothetical protein
MLLKQKKLETNLRVIGGSFSIDKVKNKRTGF